MLRFQRCILLLWFLFVSVFVYGQNKSFSIVKTEPKWLEKVVLTDKKPVMKEVDDGYYLFLYENQHNLDTQEEYEHFIRNIVNDNGVQNGSEISVKYDPSYQKLSFHKVIVWRNNKPINKLDQGKIKLVQNETELSKFIYSGTFDAYLILDDVRKGDRIEYAYTVTGHNPVFQNKFSTTLYFQWNTQLVNIYQNIVTNTSRQLRFNYFSNPPSLKTKERNGLKIYEWQGEMTKSINDFENEPSWHNPYARVQISEIKTWKEVVDWALQISHYDLSKSVVFKNKVKELKDRSKGNKEVYLNLAARFVQDEIRYMGIEMGEYSHRPNSPEKIIKQRYGDCKDKSLLLVSLLRANDITAYGVFINTYNLEKTKLQLPAYNIFDHEVCVVEFNGKKIWIDATISDQGGSISANYFPYTASVLVIKPGNNALELVKANPQGKIFSESVVKLKDTTTGNRSSIVIKSIYSANCADVFRSTINQSSLSSLKKDYLDYYSKLYPSIKSTKEIEIRDDRINNRIYMTECYEVEDIWERQDSTSNELKAYFYGDMINNELRSLKSQRPVPLQLKYPVNIHQQIKVIVPKGYFFNAEEINIKRNAYQYHSSVAQDGDTLLLDYNYENLSDVLAPNESKQYVKDYTKINNDLTYVIYWNQTKNIEREGINTWAALVALFVLVLSIYGAIYIYKQPSLVVSEELSNAPKISGLLIIVAIGVTVTPILQLFTFFKLGHLNNATWANLSHEDLTFSLSLKTLLFSEIVTNVMLIVYSVLIVFLFYNRRKSLPKHYIIFRVLTVAVPILDIVFVYSIYANANVDLNTIGINLPAELMSVIRAFIFSAIWIAYFLKSNRVKKTFVFAHSSQKHTPVIHEELAINQEDNSEYEQNSIEHVEDDISDKKAHETI